MASLAVPRRPCTGVQILRRRELNTQERVRPRNETDETRRSSRAGLGDTPGDTRGWLGHACRASRAPSFTCWENEEVLLQF